MADRPACSEARPSETEFDVTPEMIEAGLAELYESGAIEHPLRADRLLVRRVYLAMSKQYRA